MHYCNETGKYYESTNIKSEFCKKDGLKLNEELKGKDVGLR